MKFHCNTGQFYRYSDHDGELETQFLWYLRHFERVPLEVNVNSTLDAPLIIVHDGDGNESDAIIVKRNLRSDYDRLDSAKMSWYWFKTSDITMDYILFRKMDVRPQNTGWCYIQSQNPIKY